MSYPEIIVNSSNLYGIQLNEAESLDYYNKYKSREDRVISGSNIVVRGSQRLDCLMLKLSQPMATISSSSIVNYFKSIRYP